MAIGADEQEHEVDGTEMEASRVLGTQAGHTAPVRGNTMPWRLDLFPALACVGKGTCCGL